MEGAVAKDPMDWVKSTVFYQIFPDRFAKSQRAPAINHLEPWDAPPTLHGFKGGDLYGIIENLDYIQDMGFNGIYLNPVFSSTANHRYHTYDYFEIDPILGGKPAFREFMAECRRRKLRVVLDGVFNHASRGFFQFNHTLENGQASPYKDWFYFNQEWLDSGRPVSAYCAEPHRFSRPATESSLDLYGYRAWWDIPALPKFNTQLRQVREFLWRVAEYWMEQGIDGWRLDVANEIDDDTFWREFRLRVKGINPSGYIVGEIWDDARRWLNGDQFDGVTNYPLGQLLLGFCLKESLNFREMNRSGLKSTRIVSGTECQDGLIELFRKYPEHAVFHQLNFVTSHDTPRLLTLGSGDVDGIRMVLTGMMTLPGAPCVYYGEEVGMAGGHDPDCRRGFEWDPNLWNQVLKHHCKQLIALRHRERSLQEGAFQSLYADQNVLIYRRFCEGSEVIVGLNTSRDSVSINLDLPMDKTVLLSSQDGWIWKDGLGLHSPINIEGTRVGLSLNSRSSGVWCKSPS